MKGSGKTGDRIVALFLLGVLALNAPILSLFSSEGTVFGAPILYLYLFTAWATLILLMALTTRGRRRLGTGADRGL